MRHKKLLYICEGMAIPEGVPLLDSEAPLGATALPPAPGDNVSPPTGTAYPGEPDPVDVSMAFKLHSRPGASRILLLDFDGKGYMEWRGGGGKQGAWDVCVYDGCVGVSAGWESGSGRGGWGTCAWGEVSVGELGLGGIPT